ncbi:MAG: hypothetical protein AABW50_03190 [Nanoarchaeota archaeon]
MKKRLCLVFSVLLIVLLSFASANFATDFWKRFTGQVPSQPQNISITVVGANPVSISVPAIVASPTENTFTNVVFSVNVTDPNGVNDINDSSVSPEINNGAIFRIGSCSFSQDINSTTANYSCSVLMWYFDPSTPSSSWTTRVQAKDLGNQTLMNGTAVFTYGLLKSMVISPSQLFWPSVIPGASNQNSSNDPTIINNTGNYNGIINVTAYNLLGETIPSESIVANSFSVSSASGSECLSGTTLSHSISAGITGSSSNPGNLSAGGGQANLYYCIPLVPTVSSQVYSTTGGSSWAVTY